MADILRVGAVLVVFDVVRAYSCTRIIILQRIQLERFVERIFVLDREYLWLPQLEYLFPMW